MVSTHSSSTVTWSGDKKDRIDKRPRTAARPIMKGSAEIPSIRQYYFRGVPLNDVDLLELFQVRSCSDISVIFDERTRIYHGHSDEYIAIPKAMCGQPIKYPDFQRMLLKETTRMQDVS